MLFVVIAVSDFLNLLAVEEKQLRDARRNQIVQKQMPFVARNVFDDDTVLLQKKRFGDAAAARRPAPPNSVVAKNTVFGVAELKTDGGAVGCHLLSHRPMNPTPEILIILRLADARAQRTPPI